MTTIMQRLAFGFLVTSILCLYYFGLQECKTWIGVIGMTSFTGFFIIGVAWFMGIFE